MGDTPKKPLSYWGAIARQRCPRCRRGKLFTHPAYSVRFGHMHKHCPICGVEYEVEPGFFYGAMYVSYAIQVAIFVTIGIGTYYVFNDPPIWVYMLTVVGTVLLFFPLIFRYARTLYLHWFSGISYQPKAAEEYLSS